MRSGPFQVLEWIACSSDLLKSLLKVGKPIFGLRHLLELSEFTNHCHGFPNLCYCRMVMSRFGCLLGSPFKNLEDRTVGRASNERLLIRGQAVLLERGKMLMNEGFQLLQLAILRTI